MSVSIRDIAKELKINPATVSSCLSGSYRERRISEKTAERVRKKAAEMGYIPNRLAGRIFGRNRRKNIALILKNDPSNSRLATLNRAIRILGEQKNCDFSVLYSKTANLQDALKNGFGLGIRDFIVIGYMRGYDFEQSRLDTLPPAKIYAIDYYFDATDREFPSVVCKIGFNRTLFYKQMKSAYEKAGMGPVKVMCALEPGQKKPAEKDPFVYRVEDVSDPFLYGRKTAPLVEKYVRAGKCRTLMLRSDSMAVGLMEGLLERGIRIPEDVALIGFDNDAFSGYAKVPLTSVDLNFNRYLEDLLKHILEDKPVPPVILSMPKIVFRKSAPPPADGFSL